VIAETYGDPFRLAQFGECRRSDELRAVIHVEEGDGVPLCEGRFGYSLHCVKIFIGIHKYAELHACSLLSNILRPERACFRNAQSNLLFLVYQDMTLSLEKMRSTIWP
jgi:hypothetical protein